MTLHPLPAPDILEYTLPEGHCCLITDDGSRMSTALASALARRDWKPVLLSFPPTVVTPEPRELPAGVAQMTLDAMSEAALQAQLTAITETYGPVGALIHLHPTFKSTQGLFDARERAIVKQVFLLAKHLQPTFAAAAPQDRAAFMTVTRLDGALGLRGRGDGSLVGAGLPGLVKSLNLEWAGVFCRAVDLDPAMAPEDAARAIVAELHDPNRLIVEVGRGPQGRVTPMRS
ncbi:MAG: hypothetical protein ACP5HM_13500 [Anaerolineae bacterium]